jgi:hypothetical protein
MPHISALNATSYACMTHQSLRFLDVLVSEEKLSVQVAQVNCVKVHDVNFTEASQDEVLQKFATNSSCANHENSCLVNGVSFESGIHEPRHLWDKRIVSKSSDPLGETAEAPVQRTNLVFGLFRGSKAGHVWEGCVKIGLGTTFLPLSPWG